MLGAANRRLVAQRRGDGDVLVEAGRTSAAGVRLVFQRCQAIVRETLSELRDVARLMQRLGARESLTRLDKLAMALVMLSISSLREIAALASTTQRDALFRTMRSKRG